MTSGHYSPGWKGPGCWCNYNADLIAKGEKPSGFECSRCHTYVTGGIVDFLSDCTHALAGQKRPLPSLPPHLRD
ncbi:MAG TPA: hypothetical protein VL358_04490 [Caulobacteraceae bacterium]|nr:hypothetical protein [Caulobacteraceae bacterium]